MLVYRVYGKSTTLNSSEVRKCFNQENFSHAICCGESFTESKFDVKHVNIVKLTT